MALKLIFDGYKFDWTDKEIETVKRLILDEMTAEQVARHLRENIKDIRLLVFWLVEKGEL